MVVIDSFRYRLPPIRKVFKVFFQYFTMQDMLRDILGMVVLILSGILIAAASLFLFIGASNPVGLFLSSILILGSIFLIYFGLMKTPMIQTPRPVYTEEKVIPREELETVYLVAKLELPDGRVIPITGVRQTFGRKDFATYVTPEIANTISRNHFTIYFRSGEFYIEDAGSTNGTILNNKEIRGLGPQVIKNGDVISPAGMLPLRFRT